MLGVSVRNFTQLRGSANSLRPFIWSRVSGLMRFLDGYNKGTASHCVQISTETMAMIRQAFGEGSMSRTRKVQTHRDRKKARQVKSKVQSMLIIFFHIKGVVPKEFVLYCSILG
jgi:hypothetical protein